MTHAAERVMQEIQALPPSEQRLIWQELSRFVLALEGSTDEGEFESALDEVTGCTAEHNATGRLLDERRRESAREHAQLRTHPHHSPVHG